jgi:hypothetical protein
VISSIRSSSTRAGKHYRLTPIEPFHVNQVSTKRAFPVARIREAWLSKHRKAAQLGVEPVGNVEHRNVEFANWDCRRRSTR